MSKVQDPDLLDEEDYDEEADSDFQADDVAEDALSPSSEDEDETNSLEHQRPPKRPKTVQDNEPENHNIELDSGDEATIKEQKKFRRKLKKKGQDVDEKSDDESTGWRAKTRAMREQEKVEQKRSKLANIEGSTIDVDRIWQEMNRSGPLPPVHVTDVAATKPTLLESKGLDVEQNKENIPILAGEEMITIKRKFKFAGEVHVEEKQVPKVSAEARLWLAQQEPKSQPVEERGVEMQRPLRKISKFDPNYNNLDAFKMVWPKTSGGADAFKGPKLNVVEKSKMDWASHVDAEGLKDELDEHAKAKEGYHGRMDFLNQVEQRKEEDARQARAKR